MRTHNLTPARYAYVTRQIAMWWTLPVGVLPAWDTCRFYSAIPMDVLVDMLAPVSFTGRVVVTP